MKNRILPLLLSTLLILTLSLPLSANASDEYVTVAISNGTLVAAATLPLADTDGDGTTTVNDALMALHDHAYSGGSEAGYATAKTDYGLSMTKLWGIENGGAYGYMVNHKSPLSLADPIVSGDFIYAFVYTDTATWSDAYAFFDATAAYAKVGDSVTLTLSTVGFDADFNPVEAPLAGAVLTVDGEATELVTDENGKVTFTPDKAGSFVLSAVHESTTITAPLCLFEADAADAPATGDDMTTYLIIGGVVAVGIVLVFILLPKNNKRR